MLASSTYGYSATRLEIYRDTSQGSVVLEALVSMVIVSIVVAGLYGTSIHLAKILNRSGPLNGISCSEFACGLESTSRSSTQLDHIICSCKAPGHKRKEWHVIR